MVNIHEGKTHFSRLVDLVFLRSCSEKRSVLPWPAPRMLFLYDVDVIW